MTRTLKGASQVRPADMTRVMNAVINNDPSVGGTVGTAPQKPSMKPPVK